MEPFLRTGKGLNRLDSTQGVHNSRFMGGDLETYELVVPICRPPGLVRPIRTVRDLPLSLTRIFGGIHYSASKRVFDEGYGFLFHTLWLRPRLLLPWRTLPAMYCLLPALYRRPNSTLVRS